jgi:hypothetical protein
MVAEGCAGLVGGGEGSVRRCHHPVLLVVVQGLKLISLGNHGLHIHLVAHISQDDPELLWKELKEKEEEEGPLLVPREAELCLLMQKLRRFPSIWCSFPYRWKSVR